MLKKIIIIILIVALIGSIVTYVAYKKIEARFESFILSEVENRNSELNKASNKIIADSENIKNHDNTSEHKNINDHNDIIDHKNENNHNGIIDHKSENNHNDIIDHKSENDHNDIIDHKSTNDHNGVIDHKSTNDHNGVTDHKSTTDHKTTIIEKNSDVKNDTSVKEEVAKKEEISKVVKEKKEEVKYDYGADKSEALKLAMSKLTALQISRLIEISSGGFTASERQEAKDMFYSNFTNEEQNWILGVYQRYYSEKSGG